MWGSCVRIRSVLLIHGLLSRSSWKVRDLWLLYYKIYGVDYSEVLLLIKQMRRESLRFPGLYFLLSLLVFALGMGQGGAEYSG